MVESSQSGIVLILLFVMLIMGGIALGLVYDVQQLQTVRELFLDRFIGILSGSW
jgi:hypothetical protein